MKERKKEKQDKETGVELKQKKTQTEKEGIESVRCLLQGGEQVDRKEEKRQGGLEREKSRP